MSELKTLNKSDSDFQSYLLGTFSNTHRALPLQSLNVDSDQERVTFQIVPVQQIETPDFFVKWSQVFKLHTFIYAALPMFLIIVKNLFDGTLINPLDGLLAAVGAFFLHTSLNLRNDFVDHMKGLDRVLPTAGSRAIQKGWVTAQSVKVWAWIYFILGVLFGLKPVLDYPQVLLFVGSLSALGVILITSFRMGVKYRSWTELLVFLLLGPFLTSGFQLSFGAPLDVEAVLIGLLTGWVGVFSLHLRNFELLMVQSQARFRNSITHLGFDSSKVLLKIWWSTFCLGLVLLHVLYSLPEVALVFLVSGFFASFVFWKNLDRLQSPLGSDMTKTLRVGKQIALLQMSLWFSLNFVFLILVTAGVE
ncbi:MAG: prenyltransferase [Proteobacteria bacterium]|jgi:1,4-dihydroxy-2-naphthoate octaprenyltransferase|nr:prenyltransferase [Pseudomonadota bacterium]